MLQRLVVIVACLLLVDRGWGQGANRGNPPVSFTARIKPILANRCFGCHGPGQQLAQLRLDSSKMALRGGISGPAILPGKSQESLLYRRIAGGGPLPRMPMGAAPLPANEIALVAEWIDQGAPWPAEADAADARIEKHWAYQRPRRSPLPQVRRSEWVRNPIDRFVLAKIEAEGLSPSAEAFQGALLRRVSLDLTGLPPSLEELNTFLADVRPDAYERAVDRLLASPEFGVRWAQPWLDLARFADSNGYGNDLARSMWLYRDWVVRALNADMPFDRFTVEQIAGDLLPGATVSQKIATGFHRNTMTNDEGGADAEEYRMKAVMDRANTTATVWLGATLACAQCHNHKYDPFTQEEYYRFVAFFNNTKEEVRVNPRTNKPNPLPPASVPSTPEMAAMRSRIQQESEAAEEELRRSGRQLRKEQSAWEKEVRGIASEWTPVDPTGLTSRGGAQFKAGPDRSILTWGANPDQDVIEFIAELNLAKVTGFRLEALVDPSLPHHGSARSSTGNFVLTGFEVAPAKDDRSSGTGRIEFTSAVSDYAQDGLPAKYAIDDDPSSGWAIHGDQEGFRVDRQVVFTPKQSVGRDHGATRLRIRMRYESNQPQHVIGKFRVSVTGSDAPERIVKLPIPLQSIVAVSPDQRTARQQQALDEYFVSLAGPLKPLRDRAASLRRTLKELESPTTMVMQELATPRMTRIATGGNLLVPGKTVSSGVPASLHPFPKDAPPDRSGLARWLVDRENPLTARVTVNRFWQEIFGAGLVETPDDFGMRAPRPLHQDLLDWLAEEFVERNWSQKALLRIIVTSASYRQDSAVTPLLLAKDPGNRLLARGPRFRMSAEMIRDAALSIGGLLEKRLGGPSVFPLQPEGVWPNYVPEDVWATSPAGDRYRRGIYTYWRRTTPYPAFVAFDAPSREFCVTRRTRTNTPLQALTTLNDPVFFEMARGLARRILSEPPSLERRLRYAFRLCLSREPFVEEAERLTRFIGGELDRLRKDSGRAREIAGDSPRSAVYEEFAAWTLLASVLLNLDETLNK